MKKRTAILFVGISLVLMSTAFYLLKYVVRNRTFEYNALAVLFTLLAVFVLYIAYRELLRRFGKGRVPNEQYAVLYGLEHMPVSGEVEFYFTISQPKRLAFEILHSDMRELQVLADREFEPGGHIVRFDTTVLPEGVYFYCLRSDNQKTMKRMQVQHDKLTV